MSADFRMWLLMERQVGYWNRITLRRWSGKYPPWSKPGGRFYRQKSYLEGSLKLGFLFAFVCGISAHLFSPWFFEFLFNNKYPQVDTIAQQVFWLVGPMTWLAAAIHTLYSMGNNRVVLFALLSGTIVMPLLLYALVPGGGALWSIFGMGTGMAVSTVILIAALYLKLRFSLVDSILKPSLVTTLGTAVYFSGMPLWLSYLAAIVLTASMSYHVILSSDERKLLVSAARPR